MAMYTSSCSTPQLPTEPFAYCRLGPCAQIHAALLRSAELSGDLLHRSAKMAQCRSAQSIVYIYIYMRAYSRGDVSSAEYHFSTNKLLQDIDSTRHHFGKLSIRQTYLGKIALTT